MNKILVIGGAGYIGSVLVPRLLEEGYRVRGLDKLFFGKNGLMTILDQIDLIVGDTRKVDASVFEGIDAVIDGWRLFQASQLEQHKDGEELKTGYLKYEFFFEKIL